MSRHFMEYSGNSIAECGADMVGRRISDVTYTWHKEEVTCILCRAILDRKPLYAVATEDEDGYRDVNYFTSLTDQLDLVNYLTDSGKALNICYILMPDEIKNDDFQLVLDNYKEALKCV